MAITYDVPSNTITVTGYTEGSPCTFLDIWNADQAGGWGVVSKQGNNQFLFGCRLVIGDGSTPSWFADKDVQIVFSDGIRTASYQALIERKVNAYIILGELINEGRKSTGRGVALINLEDTFYHYIILDNAGTGYTYLYSCSFYTHIYDRIVLQNARVWNGIFSGSASLRGGTFWVTNTDMFNVFITRGYESIRSIDAISTFNMITIMDSYRIALYGTSAIGATLKNIYVRNLSQWQLDARYDFYIVNADSDSWNIEWLYTGSGRTYRQYEFDAHCQDKDGNDLSGVSVVAEYISPYGNAFSDTSNAQGDLTGGTKTVDRSWFEQTTGNTENLKTPLRVTFSKAGYITLVKYYSLEEKTKDIAVMRAVTNQVALTEILEWREE